MNWQATCAVSKPINGYAQRSIQLLKRCCRYKMGHLQDFTYRAFVVGSVAIAEGVAFGVRKALQYPLKPISGAVLKRWLIIN